VSWQDREDEAKKFGETIGAKYRKKEFSIRSLANGQVGRGTAFGYPHDGSDTEPLDFPLWDHPDFYTKDGKAFAITLQPYMDLSPNGVLKAMANVKKWADSQGLSAEFLDGQSWWRSGSTGMILLKRSGGDL